MTRNSYISFAPVLRLLLSASFAPMLCGQLSRQSDSPIALPTNFGLIERIDTPPESSHPDTSRQAKEPHSFHPDQTSVDSEPTGEQEGVSSEFAEDPTELADEFSEDELKEMLFGEDAIEEEPQPVEELPDRKKWIPSFPTSLASGIPTIRCTDLTPVKNRATWRWKASYSSAQGSRNFLTYLYLFGDGKGLKDCPNTTSPGFLWPKPNTPT